MRSYVIRRLLGVIPALFIGSILIFLIIHLIPGDPAVLLVPMSPPPTPELIAEVRAAYGFDKPLHEQYLIWLGKLLRGDLGDSISKPAWSVAELVTRKIGVTLHVTVGAFLVSVLIALPLGIRMGLHPDGFLARRVLPVYTGIGFAIPPFWLGILLILFFSVFLGVLPTSGFRTITEDPIQSIRFLIMPSLAGGISGAVVYTNFISASIGQIAKQEFILAAIAKGLPRRRVVYRHILKNALIPVVTVAALQLGTTVGGAVVTESVFGIPGIGRLLVDAITARDYAVVQADFMVLICAVMLANLLADLLYGWLDPRIRLD